MKFTHILLTTDLSDESRRAFAPASEMAQTHGARLTLLHVVHDVRIAPHGAPLAPPVSDPDVHGLMQDAKGALNKQRELLSAELNVDCEVIAGSNIANAVAEYAAEHEVDLIMLSTHGRTGFRRLVLGSVAESILHCAHVPVLCFPRPE
jgi:nucleotide-binding universal stress UspA family protein